MATTIRFTLISVMLFAGFSIALPVWAATVKVTPLGSHDGEFCSRDRALILEDTNGTRIVYTVRKYEKIRVGPTQLVE